MRFAAPLWLFGSAFALLIAALFIAGSVLRARHLQKFGDTAIVSTLLTAQAGARRAWKGVLCVLAVALAFLAAAQPQYGRGTKLIPATNLDLVIVLDYSKSMYARDITPSRTLRAKSEVARLISSLPGARFGAVAFAGQPIAFPLTSDGPAISQFFQQMTPNDMPVVGTAIARALEAGRELLARDPLSKTHKRVILLVTDGEDLEGDPVSVATAAAQEEITIFVVQIGGRTPEPIPQVTETGEVKGIRTDMEGKPLTTSLSAEGEAQLGSIASATGGAVVRSEGGQTGLGEIERRLKQLMTEELSERVETIYADVYLYPLGLALLLVLIESFIPEAGARKPTRIPPPKKRRPRRRGSRVVTAASVLCFCLLWLMVACAKQRNELWMRNAPAVDEAIAAYDAGDAGAAVTLLEQYLATGKCDKGNIGAPESVRSKPNASFDLGLGLFKLGEQYGLRFGEPDPPPDASLSPEEEAFKEKRGSEVECALRIVRIVAADASLPIDLRARAFYLAGNLEFLRGDYESAVKSYDASLELIPGLPVDGGADGIGRDAAYNRAIALSRIQDQKKDAGPDSGPPDSGPPDSGPPDSGPPDGGQQPDGGQDQKDQPPDAGDDGGKQDQPEPQDGGPPDAGKQPEPEAQQQQQPPKNQDERMLDMLERAPSVQQQDAKNRALQQRQRLEDK
ncbi:MAG TPA: VWA domain-containing protein [Polyangiaceae bacterium]|nr:VWA domain-containing protein [Polyangiaceae bacterium]